jgi:hypothetical protein
VFSDHAGKERGEPGALVALACLLAAIGLVASVIALYTVHVRIPLALECNPPGPTNDPGPDPDPRPLVVGFLYLVAYVCVFVGGFWVPWSLLGRRRLTAVLVGCLLAPTALLGAATADLTLHVAPEHGLHFHFALPDHIRLASGPCPPS